MIVLLEYIYVFFLPFSDVAIFNYKIGILNISIFEILIISITLLLISRHTLKGYNVFVIPTRIYWIFIILFSFSLISLTWSIESKYDVKISLNIIEYFLLFYIFSSIVKNEHDIKTIFIVIVISSVLYSMITILHSLGLHFPAFQRHTEASLGPFHLGGHPLADSVMPFDLSILAAYPILLRKTIMRHKIVQKILICILIIGAMISYTRSLWLSLIFQTLLFSYTTILKKPDILKKLILIISLILILSSVYLIFYDDFINIRKDTAEHRVLGFYLALNMATESISSFLFGAGKGSFVHQFYLITGHEGVVHNLFLDILVAKGFITLILICALIFLAYTPKVSQPEGFLHGAPPESYQFTLQLVIAGMLFEGLFVPLGNSTAFWSFIALGYGSRNLIPPLQRISFRASVAFHK